MNIYVYKNHNKKYGFHNVLAKFLSASIISRYSKSLEPGIIVNWGCSDKPESFNKNEHIWFNEAENIKYSVNKINMFRLLEKQGLKTYQFIINNVTAALSSDVKLVARHLINSHSGNGIEIIEKGSEIPTAPLYTIFKEDDFEVRLFVIFNEVICYAQKKKMSASKLKERGIDFNPDIKTYNNGWVYSINNCVQISERIKDTAVKAIAAVGLDFGCVDIQFTDPEDPTIIETNSAPGLRSHTTTKLFLEKLKEKINLEISLWET